MYQNKFYLQMVVLFAVLVLSVLRPEGAPAKIICSGHPDYKPFMWQFDETLVGAGPELIRSIFDELGEEFEIRFSGPWARVQEMTENQRIDFLAGAYNNAQRREYMIYLTPYAQDLTSVFVRAGSAFDFNSEQDLIGRQGVTLHGDSFGDRQDRFMEEQLKITRVYTSASMLNKLTTGQTDYMIWGDFPCQINAYMQGMKDLIMKLSPPLTAENMHITVSKKSPYVSLVPKMNVLIEKARKSGKVKSLLDKYIRLYFGSQKFQSDTAVDRRVTVWLDKSLEGDQQLLSIVSKQVWPASRVMTKALADDPLKILARDQLCLTDRLTDPSGGLKWIEIEPGKTLLFHSSFTEADIAQWELTYEALKNSGFRN